MLILTNIANDENHHSDILIQLFEERGIELTPAGPDSTYWEEMPTIFQTDYQYSDHFLDLYKPCYET